MRVLASPVEPYGLVDCGSLGSAVRLLSVSLCASCASLLELLWPDCSSPELPCVDCSSLEPAWAEEPLGVGVLCGQFILALSPHESFCATGPLLFEAPDEADESLASAASGALSAPAMRVASNVFVRINVSYIQYLLLAEYCWFCEYCGFCFWFCEY